ncbi:MAG TPA: hypothetical protein VFK51_00555 [Burkholderiales bacterium]|nr:hypothetical protein [Burkholderiales bacterium]
MHHFVQYCCQLTIERRPRNRSGPQPHYDIKPGQRGMALAESLAHSAPHPIAVHRTRQQFLRDDRAETGDLLSIGSNADNKVSAAERPAL